LLIEQQANVYPVPRATHIDEETIRNFQLTGLWPLLEKYTALFGTAAIVNRKSKTVFTEDMMQQDPVHHFTGSRFFGQPAFESILWQGLKRYPCAEVLRGHTVTSINQQNGEVTVTAIDSSNRSCQYAADFSVGCDGGKSMVRSALDIDMDMLQPARDWVIVDTVLGSEADAALLPGRFQYIFNPQRLTIYAHGFGLNRRWEFQLHKSEMMPPEAEIKSWLTQYINPQKITITRIAKYAHHSLVAAQWQQQHILLAGDAVHMMPPSAGQGMCSGIRDAVNLAWKLAATITHNAPAQLLATYQEERRPHLLAMLRRTLFFGSRLQGDNAVQRLWRSISINAIQRIPLLKNYLRKKYNSPIALAQSHISSGKLAGTHLPQFMLSGGQLSDDIIGYRFALVCRPGLLTNEHAAKLRSAQVAMLHILTDINQTPFIQWLADNTIDFAIARPDKIIFSAGSAAAMDTVLQQFFTAVCSSAAAPDNIIKNQFSIT
jgi:3-(3-hydroxy-phenyl)propionate hydroxylase